MILVDWARILPATAEVSFSTLAIPDERDEFDVDVAQICLPGRQFIDVEWNNEAKDYVVTLFRGQYKNQLQAVRCDNPSDVIETVKAIVARKSAPLAFESTSNCPDPVVC